MAPNDRQYRVLSKLLFFFQAEDGIRDHCMTGVQTCALPISLDREQVRDAHAAEPRHPPNVVSAQVHEHHVLGALLLVATQLVGSASSSSRVRPRGRVPAMGDRKSVRVGKECGSRWQRGGWNE